jgi:hypothetical protein
MAAHLTLYCARPVSRLTSKDLLTGMDFDSFRDRVRLWGFDEPDADSALAHLRINVGTGETKSFVINFRADQAPAGPILIHSDPDEVAEWRQSALRALPSGGGMAIGQIRDRLPQTVECVSIRLGEATIDIGFLLGWMAGEVIARLGDALLFDNHNWWVMRGRETVRLFQSP